jgi:hypothetical protein
VLNSNENLLLGQPGNLHLKQQIPVKEPLKAHKRGLTGNQKGAKLTHLRPGIRNKGNNPFSMPVLARVEIIAKALPTALVRAGVIRIDNKGRAGLNSSKTAEFRYVLPQTENPCDDDEGFDL